MILFLLILYVPFNNFQLCQDGSSWDEPVLSRGHNAVPLVSPSTLTLSIALYYKQMTLVGKKLTQIITFKMPNILAKDQNE